MSLGVKSICKHARGHDFVFVGSAAGHNGDLGKTAGVGTSHTIAASSPQGSSGTRYTFTGWSDSGVQSHMVTASTSTTSYTAGFSTSYFLTAAASPTTGGSVGVNPTSPTNDGYYASGSQVTLTATIKTGYLFVNWTGTTTSSTNTLKVTMNSPVSEAANFTNMVPVTITTSPTGLLVSMDGGSNQAAPLNLSWQIGCKHTIATFPAGYRYALLVQQVVGQWRDLA
jgi:hypothetical protein